MVLAITCRTTALLWWTVVRPFGPLNSNALECLVGRCVSRVAIQLLAYHPQGVGVMDHCSNLGSHEETVPCCTIVAR